ncbi:MAG TPA: hypothetical protein VLL97_10565 [Acidobacteriota bacterium]|nr:hypothetical protein [Acidobacteriota bacterium]
MENGQAARMTACGEGYNDVGPDCREYEHVKQQLPEDAAIWRKVKK